MTRYLPSVGRPSVMLADAGTVSIIHPVAVSWGDFTRASGRVGVYRGGAGQLNRTELRKDSGPRAAVWPVLLAMRKSGM